MPGSKSGGIKTRDAVLERYGKDYYKEIGRKGGMAETTKLKGFAANRELARAAGAIGGKKSKRGPAKED